MLTFVLTLDRMWWHGCDSCRDAVPWRSRALDAVGQVVALVISAARGPTVRKRLLDRQNRFSFLRAARASARSARLASLASSVLRAASVALEQRLAAAFRCSPPSARTRRASPPVADPSSFVARRGFLARALGFRGGATERAEPRSSTRRAARRRRGARRRVLRVPTAASARRRSTAVAPAVAAAPPPPPQTPSASRSPLRSHRIRLGLSEPR